MSSSVPTLPVARARERDERDRLDDRLERAENTLTEAANGTHEFKAQLAARKLRELRAQALLDTTTWAAKNTTRRLY